MLTEMGRLSAVDLSTKSALFALRVKKFYYYKVAVTKRPNVIIYAFS
jgi:hypothetical protein